MELSYWEYRSWLSGVDFTVVGSGITGLNCALGLRERFQDARILVIERGFLPYGASSRNAGFASFGSLSEILDDLNKHSEEELFGLIKQRVEGISFLRRYLGDREIGYWSHGSYELFYPEDEELFENCREKIHWVNDRLKPVFGETVFELKENNFDFRNVQPQLIFNKFEGQLDSGKMMDRLLKKVYSAGIRILNGLTVKAYSENSNGVEVITSEFSFNTGRLLIATNGFASKLGIEEINPARAQVLITEPIRDLGFKGTFHMDRGYYYFRNINGRVLLGGGRNTDFNTEETTEMGQNPKIQDRLEELLRNTILPEKDFKIERRWTGIMGIGATKNPVVRRLSDKVFCGVGLSGIGIAIGSQVGKQLAGLPD